MTEAKRVQCRFNVFFDGDGRLVEYQQGEAHLQRILPGHIGLDHKILWDERRILCLDLKELL
jgi:hypothetical protein